MKTIRRRWLFALLILLLVGCTTGAPEAAEQPPTAEVPPATAEAPAQPTEVQAEPVTAEPAVMEAHYSVLVSESTQISGEFDVTLLNAQSGEQQHFLTLPDVNWQHYHPAEYHGDNLYIIRRIGYDQNAAEPDPNWTDELWRYSADGVGVNLYSAKGLDFRVAPGEAFIAVEGSDNIIGSKVTFLDEQGNPLKEFLPPQLAAGNEDMSAGLMDWSSDGSVFWTRTGGPGPTPLYLDRITVPGWQLTVYGLLGTPIRAEFDLNTDTGWLVFSDYPVFFAQMMAEEFEASGEAVTLYTYALDTQDLHSVAVSKAKKFEPVWLDGATIEYNDPSGEGRLSYSLP
jgi:hypothetical protein